MHRATAMTRVLIVEDDPHFREALRIALAGMGVEAIAVADGRAALAWLERGGRPALILLDLTMPGMSGWAFGAARAGDRRFASIPVVLVTARGDANSQRHRLQVAGAVEKPVDLDHLREVVGAYLDLS